MTCTKQGRMTTMYIIIQLINLHALSMPILSIYEQQFVCSERHLLHNVFQVLGLSISNTVFSLSL